MHDYTPTMTLPSGRAAAPAIAPPTHGGNIDEDYDSFHINNDVPSGMLIDSDSMALLQGNSMTARRPGGSRASRSAATTMLASDVGSTVGPQKNPFLKSITFFDPKVYYKKMNAAKMKERQEADDSNRHIDVDNQDETDEEQCATNNSGIDEFDADDDLSFQVHDLSHWDITLKDPVKEDRANQKVGIVRKLSSRILSTKKPSVIIDDFEGIIEYSSFESGDHLVSINDKRIKPADFSAEQAQEYMKACLEKEGVLHVTAENPQGKDTIINVTIIKPRPDMSYDDLGLLVWNWPYLCVHQIRPRSIFRHTIIKEGDQIAAINDIDCSKMRKNGFAHCVNELPTEITITLIRRKQRANMSFS